MNTFSDTPPSSPGSDYIPPEDPILASRHGWHPSERPLQPPHPRKRSRYIIATVLGVTAVVILAVLLSLRDRIAVAALRREGVPPGLWSQDGTLYVAREPFFIKGLSWYGMEEPRGVPGGMTNMPMQDVFNFLEKNNFNSIRIPLAVDNILNDHVPKEGISTFMNPQLLDITYLHLLTVFIRRAAARNVLVLLDAHRLENDDEKSGGLWHKPHVPEENLFNAWKILCRKFGDEWNVMGADLFNEPYEATWGSNNATDDWKMASERMSETIHEHCPSWLVMIQGVGGREKTKEPVFWAENLKPMHDKPPEITLSKKVVLSPHVYGPGTVNQTYFKGKDFTKGMPAIWDDHFGLASKATGFATVVGEWGGNYIGVDGKWQQKFLQYISAKKMGSFYWCLNPESGDTGGLLTTDWSTPEQEKLVLQEPLPSTSVADHAIHFKYWRNWRTQ